jgi:SWI/SNF-related matrix-associated actin-dependent regulator of chromatin subfamily A-like protein 1
LKKLILGEPIKILSSKNKNILPDNLYPFQRRGIQWFEDHNGTGLLADDMGLGKSCQALCYLKCHPELRPVLIVCPATIKLNWQREITLWTGENSFILSGRKADFIPSYPFYIINYDILATEMLLPNKKKKVLKDSSWIFKLATMGIKIIIGDEIQAIANPKAIRTKGFCTLRKINSITKFISLSGTPIRNRPSEFFTLLNLLAPQQFPNRWKYLHRYCDPKHNGFGWEFNGSSNIKELNDKLKPLMLRRMKEDVLKDLPAKRKIIVPMELDKIAIQNYKTASDQFIEWIKNHTRAGLETQQNIDRLKQLAYIAKRNSVISWIEQYLESDNKLVIGTYHKNTIEDLMEHFKKIAVKIDGSVTGQKRQDAVDKFQKDEKCKLIICQLLTVPGLTLTAAAATCTIEFAWSPSDHEQFEDRVNRIGQKADSITAYYLIAPDTIDDYIMELINGKYNTIKQIIDDKKEQNIFKNTFLQNILKNYSKKPII